MRIILKILVVISLQSKVYSSNPDFKSIDEEGQTISGLLLTKLKTKL